MAGFDLSPILHDPAHPFFRGLVSSAGGVGGRVVQIGNHWYLLDLESDRYRVVSIPALRAQTDISERPGEQTLSVEGLWKRTPSTWHLGAGQKWLDRDDADPRRFNESRGVDPWEEWQLSLLNDTDSVVTEGSGWNNLVIGEFGGEPRLVASGNNGRCITIDAAGNITEVSGLTGAVYAASNGFTVWVSDITGIYTIDSGGTSVTIFNGNITGAKIWFAKDRLWAGLNQNLYDIIDDLTTDPFYTHPWDGWEWTSVGEGLGGIYPAGFSGERGQVYIITILEDGSGLNQPVVALPLPIGEVPLVVYGYVGFIAVGTSEGLRLTSPQQGELTMGPTIGEDAVRSITGFGTFLWFGWDNTFMDAAGVGRANLETFTETLAPAFATDLMASQTGQVNACASFDDRVWFTVGGTLYVENPDVKVDSGFLDTGRITFNVADHKTAVYVDVRHDPLAQDESIQIFSETPFTPFTLIGESDRLGTDRPDQVLDMNHSRSVWFQLRAQLNSGTDDDTPVLTGLSLAAQVIPDRSLNIYLPVILHEVVHYANQDFPMDINEEFIYLSDLVHSQRLVRFRQGRLSYLVFVEDFEFIPQKVSSDERDLQGTMVLKLKTAEAVR